MNIKVAGNTLFIYDYRAYKRVWFGLCSLAHILCIQSWPWMTRWEIDIRETARVWHDPQVNLIWVCFKYPGFYKWDLVYIPLEAKVVAGYCSLPFGGFGTSLTYDRGVNITMKLQNRYYTIFALMCVAPNAVTHIRTYLKNIHSDLLPMVRVRLRHSRRLSEISAIAFFSSHVTVKVNLRTDSSYNCRISHKFNSCKLRARRHHHLFRHL